MKKLFIILTSLIAVLLLSFLIFMKSDSVLKKQDKSFAKEKIEFVCDKPELQIYDPSDFDSHKFNEGKHYYSVKINITNNSSKSLRILQGEQEKMQIDGLEYSFDTPPYPFDIRPGETYENAVYLEFVYPESMTDEEAYSVITSNSWAVSLTVWDKENDSLIGTFSWQIKL